MRTIFSAVMGLLVCLTATTPHAAEMPDWLKAEAKALDKNPWSADPISTSLVPMPVALQQLVASPSSEAQPAGWPIMHIPATSSWTYQFSEKILSLATDDIKIAPGDLALGPTIYPRLAAYYAIIGDRQSIADLEKIFESRHSQDISRMATACADSVDVYDNCAESVATEINMATFAALRGDAATAQARFTDADRFTGLIRSRLRLTAQGQPQVYQEQWILNLAWYYAVMGDMAHSFSALQDLRNLENKMPSNLQGVSNWARITAPQILNFLTWSGNTKMAAKYAGIIYGDKQFFSIDVVSPLFLAADNSLQKHEPAQSIEDTLRSIMTIRETSTNSFYKNRVLIGVECRLARTELAGGREPDAQALYTEARDIFLRVPHDLGLETGHCLAQLASQLGTQDDDVKIQRKMSDDRAYDTEHIRVYYDAVIWGRAQGTAVAWIADEPKFRLLQKFGMLVQPTPYAPLFSNDELYRKTLSDALDITKNNDSELLYNKADLRMQLFELNMKNYLMNSVSEH